MKIKTCLVGGICVVAIFHTSLFAQTTPGASKTASSPTVSPAKSSARPIPFHGMISAVDQNAKTFTISGKKESRVFNVTDKTSIIKGAKAATMKDIAENEEASGAYWKNADGTLEAKMVKLGPMGTRKGKASPAPAGWPAASPSPKR